MRLPKIVYLLMLLMGLLEWMHVYPQLPVRMASHFDLYGRPNGGWFTAERNLLPRDGARDRHDRDRVPSSDSRRRGACGAYQPSQKGLLARA